MHRWRRMRVSERGYESAGELAGWARLCFRNCAKFGNVNALQLSGGAEGSASAPASVGCAPLLAMRVAQRAVIAYLQALHAGHPDAPLGSLTRVVDHR